MLIENVIGTTTNMVTLYEKCQNKLNPFFTWQLVNKASYDVITFYQDDTSPAPYYYNLFDITIATNSIGLTQGLIPLKSGEWNYTIYEQAAPYILSTASAVGIVETGLLILPATFSALTIYAGTYSPAIDSIKTYRG